MFELQSASGTSCVKSLVSADGIRIACRFFEPAKLARACALVLPGGGMNGDSYVAFARLLANAAIRVVVMDPRGHGLSEGLPGHVDRPSRYAEDFVNCVLELRCAHQVPVFAVAHSGSVAIVLNSLERLPKGALAGIALLAPSFADDITLFPTNSRFLRRIESLRYWLGIEAPQPAPRSSDAISIRFSYGRYLLARLTGFGARRPILTFSGMRNEPPYSYEAGAVAGLRVGRLEKRAAAITCPVFLATGGADPYVHSAAVQTVLPWALPRDCAMTAVNFADGDHYTVLLRSVRALSQWIAAGSEGSKP